jgi:hypothetical protein
MGIFPDTAGNGKGGFFHGVLDSKKWA